MSMQDKLAKAFSGYRRKCMDLAIQFSGTESNMIQIRQRIDKYGDSVEIELQKKEKVTVLLSIPEEVPVDRLRTLDNLTSEVPTQQVSLFDVLPIEMWVKFSDNAAKGDIFIKPIYFEHGNQKPYFLVLEIADAIANIDNGHLVWIKYNAAPCTKQLSPLIKDYMELELGITQQRNDRYV